jgi:hypothetical protein
MLFWRRQLGHEEVVDHLCLFFGQPFLKELEVFLKRGGDHLGSSHESKLANEDILHNRNCRGPVDGFLGQPGVAPRSRDGRRLCVTPVGGDQSVVASRGLATSWVNDARFMGKASTPPPSVAHHGL